MNPLGKAFGDGLRVGRRSRRHNDATRARGWGARVTVLYLALVIGFFVLLIRMFHLTVVNGSQYRRLAQDNRLREIPIHAPRGVLFDRTGKSLVRNVPAFRLRAPCADSDFECVTKLLADDVLAREATASGEGVLEIDVQREYLYPEAFAHVLGFLSEITRDELDDPYYAYQNYTLGDRIGRSGVEALWERRLRGTDGVELIEVDAAGDKLRRIDVVEPVSGEDIVLALDHGLQQAAYQALDGRPGAVVVSKPITGEILALVSTPSFDVNDFQRELSQREYDALLADADKPMFNRAATGVYPPGSTFKLITAVAALQEDAIDPETRIEDTGVLRIGRYSYANWYFTQYGRTEGSVDLLQALARSNDIFFYKTGEFVGIERLARWARTFGVGNTTGIGIEEAVGVMPDPDWRLEHRGDRWFLGDTYHAAIGQGDIQVTPLQVNMWTNVFANDGQLCSAQLTKLNGQQSAECRRLNIAEQHIALVREGMRRACYRGDDIDYQGTGWPFFDFPVSVACKTGTAEFNDPDDATHAWFTAFAPVDDPEISVTVLLESGGEGSTDAGPVARAVMQEWFNR